MAIVLKDRVKVSSGIVGTGPVTLGTAAVGYQDFSAIGAGNVTYYTIALVSGSEWEVGQGTVTQVLGVWYLSRDVVLESSNAGTLVNFSVGSKDVFVTYPAEKAIYEETSGEVLFNGGPITIVGPGVTSYTSFTNFFAEMFGNVNTYVQQYIQNQNNGSDASADYVALNDIGTDSTYYVDMGMNSSGYSSATFQIYTPNSGYVYSIGGGTTSKMFVGSADDDLILHAGGFATTNIGLTVSGTDQTVAIAKDATIGGTASITGAAEFGSTVLLSANPSLALQAATKQYVDNQVSAGLHIHEPVLVETTGNLTATYARAGATNINITGITNGTDIAFFGSVAVNDQIYIDTATNGLLAYTAYFIVNVLSPGVAQVSLTFGGAIVTGLTNGSFTQPAVINSGVGAKLTNAGTQVALTIDNVPLALTNRVMVRLQTNAFENGVYTVTTVGSGATNWELTRATDSNKVNPADPNGVGTGDYYFTQDGDLNAGDSHVLTTEPNTMIIGYTDLTFTQFSGGVTYTGVAPIDVTGQLISLTGTVAATNGGTGVNTVATGDLLYGSATDAWSKLTVGAAYKPLVVNAGGTNVEWNALALNQAGTVSGALPIAHGGTDITTYTLGDILYASAANTLAKLPGSISTTKTFLTQTGTGAASAAPAWGTISASDVSGLAPSATTDTTNAANITSGTLPFARLNGSYTGITGVGTITAGTWNGGTLAAIYGGTGISSYTTGDLLYASSSTAISNLADVIAGNVLLSGGVSTAPLWGKVGLATHVDGTLTVGNGGTGATTLTGYVYGNGTSAMTASTSIPNSATTATDANTASAIVARDGSGNFTAGTITAALSGNATTATSATTATTAGNVSGVVAIANGGTGATTRQDAIDALAGAVTSGSYLRGDGTDVVMSTIQAADVPTLNQNTTGTAANVTGVVAIANGGTGASAAATARTNLGATTLGGNLYTITNPSAITFPRFNADNTVSSLSAADFKTAIGTGSGTVTSVSGTGSYGGLTLTGTVTTSGSLTLGGTPTGTWPISISGSAATAAASTTATTASNVAASADQAIVNQNNGNALSWYGRILSKNSTSDKAAFIGTYGSIAGVFAHNNALNAWADLYVNTSDGSSGGTVRTTASVLMGGNQALHAGNYTSYAPSLTGSGASGTWGINVTGSAGSATTATNLSGGSVSASSVYNGGFWYTFNDGNRDANAATWYPNAVTRGVAWFFANAGTTGTGGNYAGVMQFDPWTGTTASTGDASYQMAFGSTAANNGGTPQLRIRKGIDSTWNSWYDLLTSANYSSYAAGLSTSNSLTGQNYFVSNRNTSTDSPPLQAYSNNSGGAIMAFHRGGYYAVNFGLDSDNVMRIGGWSAAVNRWQLDMSGNGTYAGNVTAYSDERLKKDWTPLAEDFVEKLATVKAGTYTRIDSDERQAGSSAQDWQKLLPEVVSEGADDDKTLALAYGNAALVSAVELAKRVVEQDVRIAKLEALVAQLIKGNTP